MREREGKRERERERDRTDADITFQDNVSEAPQCLLSVWESWEWPLVT